MDTNQENNQSEMMPNNGGDQMMYENDDEIDLTPYEEDDDATLHRKLVAAKIARKRAEEDLKLLSNRISLLKQEEVRAYKKID